MYGPDHVQDVNKYINDYIKFADAKAGSVLTFTAAVGALAGAVAPTILEKARALHWTLFMIGLVACGAIALSVLMVLLSTVSAISPRVNSCQSSLVSFPDIAKLEPQDYANQIVTISSEQVAREYANHNAMLSRIAVSKFEGLSNAMSWVRVSLIGGYVAALLYAITKAVT